MNNRLHGIGESDTTRIYPCGQPRNRGTRWTRSDSLVTCEQCKLRRNLKKFQKAGTDAANRAREAKKIKATQEPRTQGQNLGSALMTIELEVFGASVAVTGSLREVAKVLTLLGGRTRE